MADIELNEDPASTWGASEAYKAAWNEKYGEKDDDGNVVVSPSAPNDKVPGAGAGTSPEGNVPGDPMKQGKPA